MPTAGSHHAPGRNALARNVSWVRFSSRCGKDAGRLLGICALWWRAALAGGIVAYASLTPADMLPSYTNTHRNTA